MQDLKDHFRSAGDVVFTDAYNDGTGIVEFSRYEDFKRALRDMDDSKFRSHEVSLPLYTPLAMPAVLLLITRERLLISG